MLQRGSAEWLWSPQHSMQLDYLYGDPRKACERTMNPNPNSFSAMISALLRARDVASAAGAQSPASGADCSGRTEFRIFPYIFQGFARDGAY